MFTGMILTITLLAALNVGAQGESKSGMRLKSDHAALMMGSTGDVVVRRDAGKLVLESGKIIEFLAPQVSIGGKSLESYIQEIVTSTLNQNGCCQTASTTTTAAKTPTSTSTSTTTSTTTSPPSTTTTTAPAPAPGLCTASKPCSGLYSFAKEKSDVPPGVMWINTRAGEIAHYTGKDVWKLVRRVKSGTTWHPATDRMAGTDVYGNYDGWIGSDNTFSIKFDDMNCDQYLFADLYQHGSEYHIQTYMIIEKDVLMRPGGYDGTQRNVPYIRSNSCSPPPGMVADCRANIKFTDDVSTPWIAVVFHHHVSKAGDPDGPGMLYAANSAKLPHQDHYGRDYNGRGYNVYCRVQT